MSVLLANPFALAGLVAVPVLVAVYLFHRRPRTFEVSSLMLWEAIRRPHGGGRRVEPPRFPWTFWLELLMLLLLIAAAAGPLLPRLTARRPLIVILDDSLSMQARTGSLTAQERARELIAREVIDGPHKPVRFILAGETPRVAGPAAHSGATARAQLAQWTCSSTSGDIDAALVLATQMPERNALVLVVTDAAPARSMGPRIRWTAFGDDALNVAFVAAGRWSSGRRDRVVVELANFSDEPAGPRLRVTAGATELRSETVPLGANARRSIAFDVPSGSGAIEAVIDRDAAAFDDRIVLLPDRRPLIRVALRIADEALRDDVRRAIDATERAVVTSPAELLVTDSTPIEEGAWVVQFVTAKGAAHAGPYLIDRTHPLAAGVSLDDVIWSAPPLPAGGAPLVSSGRAALITDEALSAGRRHIRIGLHHRQSNLQDTTAWPALFWNLIEWRAAGQPGFRAANVANGSIAELVVGPDVRSVVLTSPSGRVRSMQPAPGSFVVPVAAAEPGVWTATAGTQTWRFASNALVPLESDLRGKASGEKSSWKQEAALSGGYANIAPLLLLAALAIATLHQRLTAESVRA